MNDFLHSLRNGNGKRFERPRKNYDNPQYRAPDRLNREKKTPHHRRFNDSEQMANIKKVLDTMAENLDRIQNAQERTADAIERIADYLQLAFAAQGLQALPTTPQVQKEVPAAAPPAETESDMDTVDALDATPIARETVTAYEAPPKVAETPKRKRITTAPAAPMDETKKSEKEIIVDIIHSMREDGIGFEQIAEHLEMLSMPTFSGKGKWRAQNVSRVFNMYANRG
jgi:hypothetical protein